ncbi:MAG: transposase [Deferribacteres bacterium]|nr:transposase [Deferribacteres bacterium]
MDDELKKRIAVFRYGVIADIVGGRGHDRGEKKRLIRDKSARKWDIPGSSRSRISETTIKQWVAQYRASGNKLESLYPRNRSDRGKSRAIGEETAQGLIALRKEQPELSLPVFMREAKQRKIIQPGIEVPYSTLYRFLQTEGMLKKPLSQPEDRRRFEAEYPNDLWQSDVMHGPYVQEQGKQRKTYLIAFLDDMSRLGVYGEFYHREDIKSYLEALRKGLRMRGIPKKLYVDNGPAFRSHHLQHTCASLGIALINSRPYQPEGRGKIERWFRTVRESFLSTAETKQLKALNESFGEWLNTYNHTTHSITKEPPIKRYTYHIECIRAASGDMEEHFRRASVRTVAKDRLIALQGRLYEAPVELIGKRVNLLYHEHDPATVEIQYQGRTYGFAAKLDVNVNCRIKRGRDTLQIQSVNKDRYKSGKLFNGKDGQEKDK